MLSVRTKTRAPATSKAATAFANAAWKNSYCDTISFAYIPHGWTATREFCILLAFYYPFLLARQKYTRGCEIENEEKEDI